MEIIKNVKKPVHSVKEWEELSHNKLRVVVDTPSFDNDGMLLYTIHRFDESADTYVVVINGIGGHPEIVDAITSVIEGTDSNFKFTSEFYNDVETQVQTMFD